MTHVRWTTAALLLPLYVGLLLTVGHYASQLEATYQPGIAAAGSAPVNYSQDRVSRLLPPARVTAPAVAAAPPVAVDRSALTVKRSVEASVAKPVTVATAPVKNTPATNPGTGPATGSAVDNGAGNGAAALHRKKP